MTTSVYTSKHAPLSHSLPVAKMVNVAALSSSGTASVTIVSSSSSIGTKTAAATTTTATGTGTTVAENYLTLHSNVGDVTKKGSTSTIWTSEESILRSVGAVDEDNK